MTKASKKKRNRASQDATLINILAVRTHLREINASVKRAIRTLATRITVLEDVEVELRRRLVALERRLGK